MTVSELASISAISEKQLKKRWKKIPGALKEHGIITFPDGSRYPFDVHRYKFNNQMKRRLALLDAISHYRYVDHISLKMSEESFKSLIEELVAADLIKKNGTCNQYGANGYDTTLRYDEMNTYNISKKIDEITSLIASATGHFVGAYINARISA